MVIWERARLPQVLSPVIIGPNKNEICMGLYASAILVRLRRVNLKILDCIHFCQYLRVFGKIYPYILSLGCHVHKEWWTQVLSWWIDFHKWYTSFHVERLRMLLILPDCSFVKWCVYMGCPSLLLLIMIPSS